jgi:hypothetical protein
VDRTAWGYAADKTVAAFDPALGRATLVQLAGSAAAGWGASKVTTDPAGLELLLTMLAVVAGYLAVPVVWSAVWWVRAPTLQRNDARGYADSVSRFNRLRLELQQLRQDGESYRQAFGENYSVEGARFRFDEWIGKLETAFDHAGELPLFDAQMRLWQHENSLDSISEIDEAVAARCRAIDGVLDPRSQLSQRRAPHERP